MKYGKVRGESVAECIKKIRQTYGSNAIIQGTRELKEGGILGTALMSRRMFEVDYMIEESPVRRTSAESILNKIKASSSDAGASTRRVAEPVSVLSSHKEESPAVADDLDEDPFLRSLKENMRRLGSDTPEDPADHEITPAEMAALLGDHHLPAAEVSRKNSYDLSKTEATKKKENNESPAQERSVRLLAGLREKLRHARLSPEFAENVIREVDESLSLREKNEKGRIEQKSIETLTRMIRAVPDIAPPRGECRAVMLVGPTGVGKTTSLAKLAARYHLMNQREVSIYSLDTYRLAATEQLKTYAGVMGTAFYAPVNADEFAETIRHDGAELMLIDTSGISHKDKRRMEELKAFTEVCPVRLEVHLVIAASMDPALVEEVIQAYEYLGFDKIILTKLDETPFIGTFIEHADKYNRPFSFLTMGQEVPGDIKEAGSLEMAKMVLTSG